MREGVSNMATYVYGNTVRKSNAVPKQQPVVQPKKPKEASQQVRHNRKKALHMNAGYVVFLTMAAVIALFVCVQYLQLQSELTTRSKNITSLQRELSDIKEENVTKYNNIVNSMNLEEIREKAINELGMVYAEPGQVIKYKSPTSNAVIQYASIPESGIVASAEQVGK